MKYIVDIAQHYPTPGDMSNDLNDIIRAALAPTNDPSVAYLAKTYGITRQNLYLCCKKHGMKTSVFECPEIVFQILAAKGRRSPLRTRLADPAEQARIKASINLYHEKQIDQRILANRASAQIQPRTVGHYG